MKRIIILILAFALVFSLSVTAYGWNKQIFDLQYEFNYAYIDIPGGKTVEGRVESWTDFEDGDQLQIRIGGVVYLTDTTRAVLVYDPRFN